jgi:hypothetical protein
MKKSSYVQPEFPNFPPRVVPAEDKRVLMSMYVLKSPVLRDFAYPLGINAYNVGLAVERYVHQKIIEVGLRGYGSILAPEHDRNNPILVHPEGSDWRLEPLPDPSRDEKAAELVAQLPDGSYRDGMIMFRMPHKLRIAKVEAQFHYFLGARNLNLFLESNTGQERLAKSDMPANIRLFTDYVSFREPHRSLASKIYLVRPRHELAVLLQALVLAIGKNNGCPCR